MENSYRIAIIGGTGKVGRHIATKALQRGYQVRMLVRNPDKLTNRDDRIEVVIGNIQDTETLRTLLSDCHVVINTFGQPSKEKPLYSGVTEQIFELMRELHIDRYIGVSGGSLTIEGDKKSALNRLGAKMFEILFAKMMVDKKKEWTYLLHNNKIDWTLIRLPFVVDGPEAGIIKEDLTNMPGTKITNKDIASFIMNQVEDKKYIHRAPFISN